MDVRRLEHFLVVAEERSFTRAAARLHLVQSGVSASIRTLERELGTDLFERTTQRVDLTPAGHALVPEARRVLGAVRTARQVVDEARAGLRGTLELGILAGLTPNPVLAALAEFRATHRGVEVVLSAPGPGGSLSHADRVRDGTLDLALLMTIGSLPGVDQHVLGAEDVLIACAADHPLAGREQVELAELEEHDLIDFPRGWGVREAVDRAFADAGIAGRRPTLQMNDTGTVLDLVRYGLGVAFVPSSLAARAPELRYLPVRRHRPHYQVTLASPRDRPTTPTARAFLTRIREQVH